LGHLKIFCSRVIAKVIKTSQNTIVLFLSPYSYSAVMENLTGWAAGMWAKQKMNSFGEGGKENATESKTPSMRNSIAEQRATRDSEDEKRRAERSSKKLSVADKWKANKKKK
jgi:hypothetical protein